MLQDYIRELEEEYRRGTGCDVCGGWGCGCYSDGSSYVSFIELDEFDTSEFSDTEDNEYYYIPDYSNYDKKKKWLYNKYRRNLYLKNNNIKAFVRHYGSRLKNKCFGQPTRHKIKRQLKYILIDKAVKLYNA